MTRTEAPKKNNKANAIADIMRLEIATGHWPSGMSLPPESDILRHFGVSRPPMREAMRMLESEGLLSVTRGQHGGSQVLEPSLGPVTRVFGVFIQRQGATVEHLFASLSICESQAIGEIARDRPRDVLIDLAQAAAAQGMVVNDRPAFHRYEMQFREILVNACSNPIVKAVGLLLTSIYDQHTRTISVSAPPFDVNVEQHEKSVAAKQKLIALMRKGDAEGAQTKWQSYLQMFGRQMIQIMGNTRIQYYPVGEARVIRERGRPERRTTENGGLRAGKKRKAMS